MTVSPLSRPPWTTWLKTVPERAPIVQKCPVHPWTTDSVQPADLVLNGYRPRGVGIPVK